MRIERQAATLAWSTRRQKIRVFEAGSSFYCGIRRRSDAGSNGLQCGQRAIIGRDETYSTGRPEALPVVIIKPSREPGSEPPYIKAVVAEVHGSNGRQMVGLDEECSRKMA